MKKLAFLLLMVVAFVTTSMAQVDTNKMYRLKDNATSQYLTARNYDEHAGGTNGGVGTSALAEDNEAQIFIFEQSGSNYKIKTKTGYYIYAQDWNVDALSSKSSEFRFTANGTAGYYMEVYNTHKGNWKYVKNENVPAGGGYFLFGDAAVGAAATWTFEEVAVDVPSRTITVSANNDAWGTVSGGGTAEGSITITATPADGCKFVEWQLNGIQISTQQNYIDETEGDKEYVAIFAELEPYELICKPTFNKAGNTTFVSAATILADGETSTIDVAELAVLGQQGFVNVGETYAGATFDLNLTYTLNWGDLSLFQIAGDEATSIYGPFEGSWVSGGSTTTVLTNIVNAGLTVEGTTVTYPITISSESQIGDLVVIRAITGATSACETGISEGGYIDFVFTVATPPCTVTATSSNVVMGTVTPEESKINSGNNVTLTATPNEGYEFVNWTVAGEEVSTDATYTFTVTQDIEVVANFQIIPGTQTFNITVSSANETMGSVEASTLEVIDGNTVILTATANDGYRFVNWTVAGEEVSAENPYTATITAETAFVANFEALPVYAVSVSSNDDTMGTAEISASEAIEGKTVTLTATSNPGYLFVNWTVAGEEVSTENPYTATITAETAFVANFVEKQYCTYSGNSTNAGRYLNSFTLTDGTNQVAVSNIQTAQSAVYVDKTTSVLTTNPGATLSFSAMDWTGAWMHAYVFVDYNKDKEFNQETNNNGTTGGELVTYSAYTSSDGNTFKDINGNLTPDSDGSGSNDSQEGDGGNGVSVSSIPSWTLPADLAPGNYRLRFNIVWNTKDACGYADMATNGGAMVDITLCIEAPVPTYAVSVSADATMGVAEASATEVEENETVILTATANDGYEFVNWTVAGEEVSTENPYTATITAETAFVANFQAKEYTITYIVDEEEYTTETYDFGAAVTAQAEPTKEGYTFSGWSEVPATMPANDVEVTGTFTINNYTIT
ncbi:MAG: InlB B-repeat-containing protein, partial [Bacteroidaceae bacterium]|nr:InlB B-repeat-containing protein [Bacteroidaceae bacterium]